MSQTTPTALAAKPWPEGVAARYTAAGGAHIDIRVEGHPDDPHAVSTCSGCGPLETQTFCGYAHHAPRLKRQHVLEVAEQCAQEHAEQCQRRIEAGGRHMTATGQLPRFLTRGGAVVEVIEHSREDGNVRIAAYAWRCHGCGLEGADHPWFSPTQACEPTTRVMAALHANQHATDCRSIPQHGELAGTLTLALCGLLAKLEETQPHLAPHPGD